MDLIARQNTAQKIVDHNKSTLSCYRLSSNRLGQRDMAVTGARRVYPRNRGRGYGRAGRDIRARAPAAARCSQHAARHARLFFLREQVTAMYYTAHVRTRERKHEVSNNGNGNVASSSMGPTFLSFSVDAS